MVDVRAFGWTGEWVRSLLVGAGVPVLVSVSDAGGSELVGAAGGDVAFAGSLGGVLVTTRLHYKCRRVQQGCASAKIGGPQRRSWSCLRAANAQERSRERLMTTVYFIIVSRKTLGNLWAGGRALLSRIRERSGVPSRGFTEPPAQPAWSARWACVASVDQIGGPVAGPAAFVVGKACEPFA